MITLTDSEVEMVCSPEGSILLSPCQIACPVGEDIQRTNVLIGRLPSDPGGREAALLRIGDEIFPKNPLFTLCSYICGLCEEACYYGEETGAIRRRLLKRFVSEHYLDYLAREKAPLPQPQGPKVALVGGGPASLMCAWELARRGYRTTLFDRRNTLGGALTGIPRYRLPREVVEATLKGLVRIAHVETRLGTEVDPVALEAEGFAAVFWATGTPAPHPLSFDREMLEGAWLRGVRPGLELLAGMHQGRCPPDTLARQRVIVVGSGDVAFDVARTARRLGGRTWMVCLEVEDQGSRDGIPAHADELEGAREEGIEVIFSRGVRTIHGADGRFRSLECPRCTSVWDDDGRFNPRFDLSDTISLEGDLLLVTIGQAPEWSLLGWAGLLDDTGRLDVDPVTLMSRRREGHFVGGDVRRPGLAAEAMRDGREAAESIHRYLQGEDLHAGRERKYERTPIPLVNRLRPQPAPDWRPMPGRLDFDIIERGFEPSEAIDEARRCFTCGPCRGCKGCVVLGLQPAIPDIKVHEALCGGCEICTSICTYSALSMREASGRWVVALDENLCKRCGLCVTACPTGAFTLADGFEARVAEALTAL